MTDTPDDSAPCSHSWVTCHGVTYCRDCDAKPDDSRPSDMSELVQHRTSDENALTPREWWIEAKKIYGNIILEAFGPEIPDGGRVDVIEKAEYDRVCMTLESFRKINDDDAHAIHLLTKERDGFKYQVACLDKLTAELKAERDDLKKGLEHMHLALNGSTDREIIATDERFKFKRERDQLRAENERLRAELKAKETDGAKQFYSMSYEADDEV